MQTKHRELIEVLGKWTSLAVLLAGMLYGTFNVWMQQMTFQHEQVMVLIKEKQCTE